MGSLNEGEACDRQVGQTKHSSVNNVGDVRGVMKDDYLRTNYITRMNDYLARGPSLICNWVLRCSKSFVASPQLRVNPRSEATFVA